MPTTRSGKSSSGAVPKGKSSSKSGQVAKKGELGFRANGFKEGIKTIPDYQKFKGILVINEKQGKIFSRLERKGRSKNVIRIVKHTFF